MKSRQEKMLSRIVPLQIRAARAMLAWTQDDLAVRSGVSRRSIAAIEMEVAVPKTETLARLVHSFEQAGIEFRRTRDWAPAVALRSVLQKPPQELDPIVDVGSD